MLNRNEQKVGKKGIKILTFNFFKILFSYPRVSAIY